MNGKVIIRKRILTDFISVYYFVKENTGIAISYDKRDDHGVDTDDGAMLYDIEMCDKDNFDIDRFPIITASEVPDAITSLLTFLND